MTEKEKKIKDTWATYIGLEVVLLICTFLAERSQAFGFISILSVVFIFFSSFGLFLVLYVLYLLRRKKIGVVFFWQYFALSILAAICPFLLLALLP